MTSSQAFTKGWNEIVFTAVQYGRLKILGPLDEKGKCHIQVVEEGTMGTIQEDSHQGVEDAVQNNEEPDAKEDTQEERAQDVQWPELDPPVNLSHCSGRFTRSEGGKKIWKSYLPPITLEKLPSNIKYIKSHWEDRILADGTMVIGQDSNGRFVVTHPTDNSPK
jgi:hypothetical protein